MSLLSVRLNTEEETKLEQILAKTKTNRTQLIKQLINNQWINLQAGKTFLERRGEHPAHLLSSSANLSDRKVRKQEVTAHLEKRQARRNSK